MVNSAAIERCAYCREFVPVTSVVVRPSATDGLRAEVAVCENCRHDGR
ncbi:MAG: hypothetical protein ABEJ42_00445 [Halobacteriaceae archaeon]